VCHRIDDRSDVGHLQHVRQRYLAGVRIDLDFDVKGGEVGLANVICAVNRPSASTAERSLRCAPWRELWVVSDSV
jgi:hypothetical protein